MNENNEIPSEGSSAVEQAELKVLGKENYQKAEIVHYFANTHPWFHPLLAIAVLTVVAGFVWFIKRKRQPKANS